jgi:hypothetical protein
MENVIVSLRLTLVYNYSLLFCIIEIQIQKYGQKRQLLRYVQTNHFFGYSGKLFFRGIPFRSELRNGLFRGIHNSVGMSTFFRGITESVPRLFRGIFSERNSVASPNFEVLNGNGIFFYTKMSLRKKCRWPQSETTTQHSLSS